MDKRKTYIKNLVYFALADNDFAPSEKNYILEAGKKLGLSEKETEALMLEKVTHPELPEEETLRYILFDDILNLIVADQRITPEEEEQVKDIAEELGFKKEMVDNLLQELKDHIRRGHAHNKISHTIKNSVFNISNTKFDGNYHI